MSFPYSICIDLVLAFYNERLLTPQSNLKTEKPAMSKAFVTVRREYEHCIWLWWPLFRLARETGEARGMSRSMAWISSLRVDCDREWGSVVIFLKTWKACLRTSYYPYFFVRTNAFATFRSGSSWSTEGCRVNLANSTHTICYCYHLTSFSVLMQYSPGTYTVKVN